MIKFRQSRHQQILRGMHTISLNFELDKRNELKDSPRPQIDSYAGYVYCGVWSDHR